MEDYKGHVRAPARCHILYCKVSCMEAVESGQAHRRDA